VRPSKLVDPRRLLASPELYRVFQRFVRAKDSIGRFANEFLRVQPGQRVLDIGCGPAEIRDHLPPDVDYWGFDIDPSYIAAAQARYGQRGRFAVRAVSPGAIDDLGTFDAVISIGVLHHLSDADADAVFASAAKVLRLGGRVITCDGAYVKGQNPIARLLLWLDRGRYIRAPEAYLALARRHFPQAAVTVVNDLLSIPYTHCIIEARQPSHA
jgi:SAM-dependent methyltransferase